jgi:hypothetical protein
VGLEEGEQELERAAHAGEAVALQAACGACRGRMHWGGPACCHIADFIFFKYSSNWFELIWSEGDPLVLEKFQIKYGRVDIELRSKFSYWIFSKFRTEFELKFTEPI